MTAPRTLGTVRDYRDLLGIMRERASELGMSRLELDRLARLQNGYAGKLLAPRPAKRLGMGTMGPVLAALGIELVAVESESVPQGDSRGLGKPHHSVSVMINLSRRHMRKIQRLGGKNSRKYMSRREASRLALRASRAAARARQERHKRGKLRQNPGDPVPTKERIAAAHLSFGG